MKNYFEEFYKRYTELKEVLEKGTGDLLADEHLEKAIISHHQNLNNLIMAGLGMGTLYLRMGAIIMIAEEIAKPDNEKNISFLKVIADNLVPQPPNDGEWTNIWVKYLELNTNSIWNNLINEANNQNQIIPKIKFNIKDFVEFRNNIAHQKISLDAKFLKDIKQGLNTLRVMSEFSSIFINCRFEDNTQLIFFSKQLEKPINVWPYIRVDEENKKEAIGKQPFQANVEGILPYLFSGKYHQGAKFINTQGGETKKEQDKDIEDNFKEIQKVITNFNGDKAFVFTEKIENYNKWCIGRDDELNAILAWIDKETDENVLPIFAPAGLGKGALVAKVIGNLKEMNIKHLYHFCESGAKNNLQAILYHFIIQGGWDKDINKIIKDNKSIWKINNLSPKIRGRFTRFPSQYTDVIELFQALLLSTKPENEKEDEISEEYFEKALATRDKKGELNANKQFSNIIELLFKVTDNQLHNRVGELLNRLELLISDKINLELTEKNYNRLFDVHCNLKKHQFNNNLISFIEEKYRKNSDKYIKPNKNKYSKLVILIDGLDEAAVSDHSKRISDWFYTYKDDASNADDIRSKRDVKWISPNHIKWIFTFRQTSKNNKEGFQFEYNEFNTHDLEEVQPLKGLSKDAVIKGLKDGFEDFDPKLTNEFIEKIIEKGAVKENENIK